MTDITEVLKIKLTTATSKTDRYVMSKALEAICELRQRVQQLEQTKETIPILEIV